MLVPASVSVIVRSDVLFRFLHGAAEAAFRRFASPAGEAAGQPGTSQVFLALVSRPAPGIRRGTKGTTMARLAEPVAGDGKIMVHGPLCAEPALWLALAICPSRSATAWSRLPIGLGTVRCWPVLTPPTTPRRPRSQEVYLHSQPPPAGQAPESCHVNMPGRKGRTVVVARDCPSWRVAPGAPRRLPRALSRPEDSREGVIAAGPENARSEGPGVRVVPTAARLGGGPCTVWAVVSGTSVGMSHGKAYRGREPRIGRKTQGGRPESPSSHSTSVRITSPRLIPAA